jgi:ribonuclease HIII
MDGTVIVEQVNPEKYQIIKDLIQSRYVIKSKTQNPGINDTFEINPVDGKVSFTYYNNHKFMIQSNPKNVTYLSLIESISKIIPIVEIKQNKALQEENDLNYEIHIGCDESGAGETFGSMFLGCALILKSNLPKIVSIIKNKNIRKLDRHDINELFNSTKEHFTYRIKQVTPNEIDAESKIVLLDRGYVELINTLISSHSNSVIVIDDYGASNELKQYLKILEKKEHKTIIRYKADEQFTACKIASLVARYARVNELENINKKYRLVDERTNSEILPGAGSASNPLTSRYLIEHRRQNPFSDFPPFVRKKWNNVKEIEKSYPKRTDRLSINCPHCNKILSSLSIRYNEFHGSKIYCRECGNLIDIDYFEECFGNVSIALDTSAIISRIVSKDLKTSGYFKGKQFLVPTFVYEELDGKGPNQKSGGRKEIQELSNNDNVHIEDVDTYLLAHGLQNDRKIITVLLNRNAILLSNDKLMVSFAGINHFVIFGGN